MILEAWFHGDPLVTTRSLGAGELVTEGEDGLMAPVADPAGLAHRILDLLNADARRLDDLVGAGRRAVAQNHRVDAVVGAYMELYRCLPELGQVPR